MNPELIEWCLIVKKIKSKVGLKIDDIRENKNKSVKTFSRK